MRSVGARIRARLSYANVAATIAVVLALTGGAYAAVALPQDSVGSKQIREGAVRSSELRTGAVRSRDVHNRTLKIRDLSLHARESLRGKTGPAGPPGPAAVTFRASVTSGGEPIVGNASGVVHNAGTSTYSVRSARALSGCVPSATLTAAAGELSASVSGDTVVVRTFSPAGAPVPSSFHVIVAC